MESQEQRVTIGQQEYVILNRDTVADMEAKGMPNVAQMMREYGITAQLGLRKPNGKVIFFAREFPMIDEEPTYSSPMRLG